MTNLDQIADLFDGVGAKVLRAVEVDKLRSNQHEFQGVRSLRRILGETSEPVTYPADFIWLGETDEERARVKSFCTWSDVRRNNPNRPPEYHLYYGADSLEVVGLASEGDLLVIAKKKDGALLIVICPGGSTIAQQILWLFDLDPLFSNEVSSVFDAGQGRQLGFSALGVLESLGIEVLPEQPNDFDRLIGRFGARFPATSDFSKFARDCLPDIDPVSDPDAALIAWMDYEELLFRHLEHLIVSERLQIGFNDASGAADVEAFVAYSLSVQNRRKSRAGFAFGHHIEAVLSANKVSYKREANTEGKKRPDFLFPSEEAYRDDRFDSDALFMLGAKTSCKDRWRQVLSEAARIERKHLVTLEAGISAAQTEEMELAGLQLVVPNSIQSSYLIEQRRWLYSFSDFIDLVNT